MAGPVGDLDNDSLFAGTVFFEDENLIGAVTLSVMFSDPFCGGCSRQFFFNAIFIYTKNNLLFATLGSDSEPSSFAAADPNVVAVILIHYFDIHLPLIYPSCASCFIAANDIDRSHKLVRQKQCDLCFPFGCSLGAVGLK